MKVILLLLPVIISCSKFAQEISPVNKVEVLTIDNNWKFVCDDNVIKTKEGNQLTVTFDINNRVIRCRE